jgi:hypothetical protein
MKTSYKTFTDQDIELDGAVFEHCKFVRCNLIYSGVGFVTFDGCSFDSPNFTFTDPPQTLLISWPDSTPLAVADAQLSKRHSTKFEGPPLKNPKVVSITGDDSPLNSQLVNLVGVFCIDQC